MRIAQLAPLAEAVPPKLYGGTERVVSWLTEELVDMGHEVTLFASGDSTTNAALVACSSRSLRLDPGNQDQLLAYSAMLARLAELASRFDLVHSHLDWVHIPLLGQLSVPFVTTLHGRCESATKRDPGQKSSKPLISWAKTPEVGVPDRAYRDPTRNKNSFSVSRS